MGSGDAEKLNYVGRRNRNIFRSLLGVVSV